MLCNEAGNILEMSQLKVHLITWNVAKTRPRSCLSKLFNINDDGVDIYVISLQEIETGIVETAMSFISYDEWTKQFFAVFSFHKYFLVENVRVQGLSLCVFAHLKHLPFIRFIKTDIKRTGLGGNWGNKGGVAISCTAYGKKVCFLNTHLTPHLPNNELRIQNINDIIEFMEFDGTVTLLSHDVLFWAGDLNFRIDDLSREMVLRLIEERHFDEILTQDQLKEQLKVHKVLREFVEDTISFPPTYKFDPGTDFYDTSEKLRKPAWTDRILYRVNPDTNSLASAILKMSLAPLVSSSIPNQSPPSELVKAIEGSYRSLTEFRQSDHKPVSAQYFVTVLKHPPVLIDLRIDGEWKMDGEGQVTVTFRNGMITDGYDYLALYEKNFTDFRSYLTWCYVPIDPFQRKHVTKTYKLPPLDLDDTSEFRVGYYCDKMSCLLALSEPFTITV